MSERYEETIIDSLDASNIAEESYKEFATYVNSTRALSGVYDGLKLVQRRIIYKASLFPANKIVKSAQLTGSVNELHPHGGCYGSVVTLARKTNNLPLFDRQGNFGSFTAGASAERYTGCGLSKIGRFIYCQFIDYAPFIEGEIGIPEPEYLPCLIPYNLVEESEGIGVGLAVDTVPIDVMSLIDYYIDYISNDFKFNKEFPLKPEFRSSIIEMDQKSCTNAIHNFQDRFWYSSKINRESDNIFVVESLFNLKVDTFVRKLSDYIEEERVDFRNESKEFERYVFEIIDPSVDPDELMRRLHKATSKSCTFKRCVTQENDVSVFSSLNYEIRKQMEGLNKAIDLKIKTEKERIIENTKLLRLLSFFKNSTLVFENISKRTSNELIEEMMKFNDTIRKELEFEIDNKICKDILKKPITYLTKDHDEEIQKLLTELEILENHNRKEYLINLYQTLRDMLLDHYNSRPHSILRENLIKNPRARLENNKDSSVLHIKGTGRGTYFKNSLFLISEDGTLYRKSLSIFSEAFIDLRTEYEERICSIVSDWSRYIEIITNDNKVLCYDLNNYKYNKKIVNLDENQKVIEVKSYSEEDFPEELYRFVRTKISKPCFR